MRSKLSIRLILTIIALASFWLYPELSESQPNPVSKNAQVQRSGFTISPYAKSPSEAAEKSLEILKTITIPDLTFYSKKRAFRYAKDLGFESDVEVPIASLGSEIKLETVELKKLRVFKIGDNPRELFKDSKESIFAMSVNGQTRSSVSVAQRKNRNEDGDWRWVERGSAKEIKEIEQLKKDTHADFLLKIPGFGKFLVLETAEELVLIPLHKGRVGKLELHAGEKISVSKVFQEFAAVLADSEKAGKQSGGGLLR